METDYVKAQISGQKGEVRGVQGGGEQRVSGVALRPQGSGAKLSPRILQDRIIAVHRAWPLDDGEGVSVVGTASESPTSNFLQVWGGLAKDAETTRCTLCWFMEI